jgi:hypothetical protein
VANRESERLRAAVVVGLDTIIVGIGESARDDVTVDSP